MDMQVEFPQITGTIIKSVDDCIEVGNKIEELACKLSKEDKEYKSFYRGDQADAVLCSRYMQCKDFTERENLDFERWSIENPSFDQNDFISLAIQQHYGDGKYRTRLLDFSRDILVALRFACGHRKSPNTEAKITVDLSPYNQNESRIAANALLKLVKQPRKIDLSAFDDHEISYIRGDYFYVIDSSMKRIVRQKGCFLLMGNLTDDELKSGNVRLHKEKVVHRLSDRCGRGEGYDGYIGTLYIDSGSICSIIEELERNVQYKSSYLMAKE